MPGSAIIGSKTTDNILLAAILLISVFGIWAIGIERLIDAILR